MEKTKVIFKNLKQFIEKNKIEFFLISLILLVSLALRLYRIDEYLTFLGDEGRDVRIVRDLITKGNLVFIGPQTSIGNMYLGPLYYYLIAPFLFLSSLSPVGPAVANALIGSLTVILTWFVGRSWFGKLSGLIAAYFYALSPVAIIYSRSSWNPNPAPLFSLLAAYGIYQVWKHKKFSWLPWVALSVAAAMQMHYLCLLLIPFVGIFWLITRHFASVSELKVFYKKTLLAILLFLIAMSPLVLFDIKHQGMNFNAFKSFFTDRQTTINLNPAKSDRFLPVLNTTVTDLVLARQNQYAVAALIVLFFALIFTYLNTKNRSPLYLLLAWLAVAVLGLGVYKQHVYIHYLGLIYPAVYLLLGVTISTLFAKSGTPANLLKNILGVAVIFYLTFLNLNYSPVRQEPNRQLATTESAVDFIIAKSQGKPFNFGLIAKQNYDESYRYFFENKASQMVRGEVSVTDQLFVICEDGDKCVPEGNPAYQIAIFGPAKVVNQWKINNLNIYLMVRSEK